MKRISTVYYVLLMILLLQTGENVFSQEISGYTISSRDDIFWRETEKVLYAAPKLSNMPVIDCSIEYVRRSEGREIVYRRGPIPLQQQGDIQSVEEKLPAAVRPGSESKFSSKASFSGGILLDLPKAGETSDYLSPAGERYKYLIRASVVPSSYENNVLAATILLERAVVEISKNEISILKSEVFSREVSITGNDPLNFGLPAWELAPQNDDAVPPSLQEALLITLETPRYFGFTRGDPDPFRESTILSYAVPSACLISLSIEVNGASHIIDTGKREAGVYRVKWDASDKADGEYTATLSAEDLQGVTLHSGGLNITKDRNAPVFTEEHGPEPPLVPDRLTISTESGVAYQLPADQTKPLRHMFTHIAFRLGYRVSRSLELGIMAGQDSFHEFPSPEVDILQIADYGGVVPGTYVYVGPFVRLTLSEGFIKPMAQVSVGFSDAATIAELGFGVRATVFSKVELFVLPHILAHLKQDVSTKVGVQYGILLRF